MLLLVLLAGACTIKLVPDYDQSILDGLGKVDDAAQLLFAAISGGSSKSDFAKEDGTYSQLIGEVNALSLQAKARPEPPPPAVLAWLSSSKPTDPPSSSRRRPDIRWRRRSAICASTIRKPASQPTTSSTSKCPRPEDEPGADLREGAQTLKGDIMATPFNVNQVVNTITANLNGMLNQDIMSFQGFAEHQLNRLAPGTGAAAAMTE